jgi:hypothetical protein
MIAAELEVCQWQRDAKLGLLIDMKCNREMRNESVFLGKIGEVYVIYDHDVS